MNALCILLSNTRTSIDLGSLMRSITTGLIVPSSVSSSKGTTLTAPENGPIPSMLISGEIEFLIVDMNVPNAVCSATLIPSSSSLSEILT